MYRYGPVTTKSKLSYTTGRDCDRQSVWGWGFVNRHHISAVVVVPLPLPTSAVRACVALLSIMPIIRGPILISSFSLPVAILACRVGDVRYLLLTTTCTQLLCKRTEVIKIRP